MGPQGPVTDELVLTVPRFRVDEEDIPPCSGIYLLGMDQLNDPYSRAPGPQAIDLVVIFIALNEIRYYDGTDVLPV